MNKRIQELAEQAGLVFWELSGDVDWRQADKETLANFAELIVEDCATLVDWILTEGGKTQGDVIREHFGEQ